MAATARALLKPLLGLLTSFNVFSRFQVPGLCLLGLFFVCHFIFLFFQFVRASHSPAVYPAEGGSGVALGETPNGLSAARCCPVACTGVNGNPATTKQRYSIAFRGSDNTAEAQANAFLIAFRFSIFYA